MNREAFQSIYREFINAFDFNNQEKYHQAFIYDGNGSRLVEVFSQSELGNRTTTEHNKSPSGRYLA